ncbi:UDPGT domain-containing protein [Cephalotus follicularis]|uniref:Glycosyltransferase n=1 Tax=Cephalotus follicularis TaxID=3775 RepID=A0A1Q3D258_CEPFO|nr:UDPGT domain-containing protein [Cephalotus follicularis]
MAVANGKQDRNIVMFPFMAHGHINPFMALARQLEQRKGYKITIVNTPLNISKLKSSLPSKTNIHLVEIPFNATDYGLPHDTENTDKLSFEFILRFLEASENLQSPFKSLLIDITNKDGNPPLCIISDMFLGWTVEVANELGIFHSVFIAGAGYSMATYFSFSLNIDQYQPDQEEFLLLDFPEAEGPIQRLQLGDDLKVFDGSDIFNLFRKRQFSLCLHSDAILLNSIDELGQSGVTYFSRKTGGKPVWSIGPACNSILKKDDSKEVSADIHCFCSSWLDIHPPASVLYVCFGSQNTILPSQLMELAKGLEASGKAFIWVIRPPIGFGVTEEFRAQWLPDGFEERVRRTNQGLLMHNWAPQLQILSHKSTGAFLGHCGWNSVLESLIAGIPMIGWPLGGEQFFNSYMLEKEVGVCIEIARGCNSAIIDHDHIARVIKMVMGETGKGEELRRKACQIKEKMEDAIREGEGFKGSSITAMDQFLETASLRNKRSAFSK